MNQVHSKTLEIKIESKVNTEEVVEIVKCIVDESEKIILMVIVTLKLLKKQ